MDEAQFIIKDIHLNKRDDKCSFIMSLETPEEAQLLGNQMENEYGIPVKIVGNQIIALPQSGPNLSGGYSKWFDDGYHGINCVGVQFQNRSDADRFWRKIRFAEGLPEIKCNFSCIYTETDKLEVSNRISYSSHEEIASDVKVVEPQLTNETQIFSMQGEIIFKEVGGTHVTITSGEYFDDWFSKHPLKQPQPFLGLYETYKPTDNAVSISLEGRSGIRIEKNENAYIACNNLTADSKLGTQKEKEEYLKSVLNLVEMTLRQKRDEERAALAPKPLERFAPEPPRNPSRPLPPPLPPRSNPTRVLPRPPHTEQNLMMFNPAAPAKIDRLPEFKDLGERIRNAFTLKSCWISEKDGGGYIFTLKTKNEREIFSHNINIYQIQGEPSRADNKLSLSEADYQLLKENLLKVEKRPN